ncbi:MAG TPA: ATP-binding protein, partial [Pyrinomonadaceae bacterium]
KGERRITVATGHDPARGLLLAEVTDTGHGIARTDFPRLFQPYFTTRGRGTGLGLAIVQRILSDHGGRIRAESNRPRGARMIIELPVAEDARENEKSMS